MPLFRKKPVVIEAHRIGDDRWPDAIWDGVNRNKIILYLGRDWLKRTTGHVEIQTLEGVMRGEIGDWIIRGVKGEFYPCKPDIFAATYEPAEAETVAIRGEDRPQAEFDFDEDARRSVEAATADLDDWIAASFAEQSAATDGGLSAEVVETLKSPAAASGFAEKA